METTLKPYPDYHEVNLPWQRLAPSNWDRLRLKYLLQEVDERTLTGHEPLLSLTKSRGLVRRSEMTDKPPSAKTLIGYKICWPGDIVMNRMQAWNGMFGLASEVGLVSPDYAVLRPLDEANPEFLLRLLRSPGLVSHFAALSTGMGSGFNRLYTDQLGAIAIAIPPREEQAPIVYVVKNIEPRVNRLIRAKQRLIALLNEQKQAIIQRAVTRGLDPDVRLKPSGVDWLGEVPAHWTEKPAKYYFREINERSATGKEELLSVSHLTGVTPRSQKNVTMFKAESYVGHKLCEPGDVVINTMWAWMAALGVAKQIGIVSPSYAVYRPDSQNVFLPEYIDYLLCVQPYVSEYICRSTGIQASRMRLYPDKFLGIPLICPPLKEQEEILRYTQNETKHIGRAISHAEAEIDLIREYRTRLIADVVTGKLDVRGVALPGVEEEAEAAESEVLTEIEEAAYADE